MKGNNSEKIIVALDYGNPKEGIKKVNELKSSVNTFKVGYELFFSGGNEIVRALVNMGVNVFLDLKLSDIPNTMNKGVSILRDLNVNMLSVHASSGRESIRAAVENKGDMLILGVTALTSFNNKSFKEIYDLESILEKVLKLAAILEQEGADGIICSPYEVKSIKENFPKLITVTPGIRPLWADENDQSRFMTPLDAIKNGSDYLVIGRPVTHPPKGLRSSLNAFNKIIEEIDF